MAIDSLNITFSCGDEKKVIKTVQQDKMNKINKIKRPVNEKQKNFKKNV